MRKGVKVGGVFGLVHKRRGRVLARRRLKNDVVDEALEHLLKILFQSDTQVDPWYIGLIDDSGFANLASGDTLASHGGWTEFTDYDGNRKEFVDGTVSSAQVDNSASKASFTINATGTIKGVFVASVATGTSGILLSTATGVPEDVLSGDTIEITYTFAADTQ